MTPHYRDALATLLSGNNPILALAPMQDVTDLAFWKVIAPYGGPDLYFTEYFRVYAASTLDRSILRSITENPTGRPVIAQLIGNDIPELVRSARALQEYPVAGIDLNLGCPAPVVYRKCAGGGLLRNPKLIDEILGALRDATRISFSVKTRIGFDSADHFDELLSIFARHSLDLLTVHARTVKEMYRSAVHYEYIKRAVERVPCPVLANGNIYSAAKGREVLRETGARGLMVGRGAIRNPWIFRQFRELMTGKPIMQPSGWEVLDYIRKLFDSACDADAPETTRVQRMKKHLNYLGVGVEPTGRFLHDIRRVSTVRAFFNTCEEHLAHDRPMPLEPYDLGLKESDLMAGVQK